MGNVKTNAPRSGKYVLYYRVSTQRQGRSGLGLAAQRETVIRFIGDSKWTLLQEFTEVESGKKNDRPQLTEALRLCQLTGATLLVAKLDRLSRNAAFLLALRDSEVKFVCCDFPEANDMMIGFMALFAQWEAERISERTREALAEARDRGVQLGTPANLKGSDDDRARGRETRTRKANERAELLRPIIEELTAQGITRLHKMAGALNEKSITTPFGREWRPTTVRRLLDRLEIQS